MAMGRGSVKGQGSLINRVNSQSLVSMAEGNTKMIEGN
jgi:hypothetical protein